MIVTMIVITITNNNNNKAITIIIITYDQERIKTNQTNKIYTSCPSSPDRGLKTLMDPRYIDAGFPSGGKGTREPERGSKAGIWAAHSLTLSYLRSGTRESEDTKRS